LRRLNEKKGYLSSLNRVIETAIPSNSPSDMNDGIIAMTSNWEERLRLPNCDKKYLGYIFPPTTNFNAETKNVNPKAVIT